MAVSRLTGLLQRVRLQEFLVILVALQVASAVPVRAMPVVGIPLFYTVHSPPDGRGELDSVALWVNHSKTSALLFLTDKTGDTVEIHDAVNNLYVGRLGSSGTAIGQLDRPNGVAVAHAVPTIIGPRDMLLVAERDNNRASVFLIPFMFPLGTIGVGELSKPYGVTVHVENGVPQAWVTSTGYSPQRVHVYNLLWDENGFHAELSHWFAVPGSAVLETLVVDPVTRRVLVCDESSNRNIMVFDMVGNLLTRFGTGEFIDDPEGMAIYDTGNGEGYIIVADQNSSPMEFELFDRRTYESLGSFTSATAGTDGLTITQEALPNLPNGALFAIHADSSLHAYDWAEIALAAGLCINNCATSDTQAERIPGATSRILSSEPNPFNPSTTIHYRLSQQGRVKIQVYDLQGRKVRTLVDGSTAAGDHRVTWRGQHDNGRTAAAGVYFLQMRVGQEISTHKITLVK